MMICTKCRFSKSEKEFHKNRSTLSGFHCQCKACRNPYNRNKAKKYIRTPEGVATQKLYRAAHKERILWTAAKHRAKVKGIEFSILVSDIFIPKVCPVLGIELTWEKERFSAATLDRKNNNLGYTPENIQIISWRANRLKGDASIKELEKILKYMKDFS